ncbi:MULTISPECIES: GNAT family N-acetyltransferase [Halomonas]|uniref:GNAT family N-acetyltransferase n=1 Tax=Halomonas TaxID=2745 RepID=UPI001A8F1E29|nr:MULTISPECIES: GNAT family N-acetyltransferase [Halomonas]MED5293933.1 GNAT family N-acetyltransferase [Pseudomonadota bacterium]MBN8414157.1 GNAT family N-acetyltransferase [Halomonas litopenaei]MBY5927151.1 GNAT family N-acetyltransferase [Halomonas sp. DP4Y7-2]MBY5970402.1 GNAT family N-acetyltransferase [Halomonas denitrificans]MBY5986060.1 GNAT family N-acetyltransferase [Halomonas sp. DP5Y7-2]
MTEVTIQHGGWEQLGEAASEIRHRVFVIEQNVPLEEEWDGRDPQCLHFLAIRGEQALGTARLLPDGHIGRVAVLAEARGLGVGVALMRAAIDAAREQRFSQVELAAQTQALGFYEALGFVAEGEVFLDAGIPHRNMTLTLAT